MRHHGQAFDEAAFRPGRGPARAALELDAGAHRGALARRERHDGTGEFLAHRLAPVDQPVIELAELHELFASRSRTSFVVASGCAPPSAAESPTLLVPLDLTGLDRYDVGSRLFAWMLAGGDRDGRSASSGGSARWAPAPWRPPRSTT